MFEQMIIASSLQEEGDFGALVSVIDEEDETKGISIIEVKLLPTQDISGLARGVKVQIPVSISAMDRNVFYKQNGKIVVK